MRKGHDFKCCLGFHAYYWLEYQIGSADTNRGVDMTLGAQTCSTKGSVNYSVFHPIISMFKNTAQFTQFNPTHRGGWGELLGRRLPAGGTTQGRPRSHSAILRDNYRSFPRVPATILTPHSKVPILGKPGPGGLSDGSACCKVLGMTGVQILRPPLGCLVCVMVAYNPSHGRLIPDSQSKWIGELWLWLRVPASVTSGWCQISTAGFHTHAHKGAYAYTKTNANKPEYCTHARTKKEKKSLWVSVSRSVYTF